jgi:hypothetical protein
MMVLFDFRLKKLKMNNPLSIDPELANAARKNGAMGELHLEYNIFISDFNTNYLFCSKF